MDFAKLAAEIVAHEPALSQHEVAQVAMILLRGNELGECSLEPSTIRKQIADVRLRLKAACDQHAATADEIRSLACSDPRKYSPDQVWTLVRAIKVQSQMLDLYAGNSIVPLA